MFILRTIFQNDRLISNIVKNDSNFIQSGSDDRLKIFQTQHVVPILKSSLQIILIIRAHLVDFNPISKLTRPISLNSFPQLETRGSTLTHARKPADKVSLVFTWRSQRAWSLSTTANLEPKFTMFLTWGARVKAHLTSQ